MNNQNESESINKRVGRERELRKKLREAVDRYELTFHKPLSPLVLKEFLVESKKHNQLVFLRDRVGVLSDQDCDYLMHILKENPVNESTVPVQVALDELDDGSMEVAEEDFDKSELDDLE